LAEVRWFPFAILAAVAIVLQTSLVPYIEIQAVRPDLMFILAAHYAMWGPWPDAAIAAWILGLLPGLFSIEHNVGVHAFCFGLAAWAIMRVRQIVFRDHAITQLLITLVFTVLIQLLIGWYRRWGAPGDGGVVWPAIMTGVYTAACAPYLHWLLIRLGRWTGLRTSRGQPTPMG
jgi:rod shape-determining protein MreD